MQADSFGKSAAGFELVSDQLWRFCSGETRREQIPTG
jgi:hypothetical protein